jgi:hypothetical protein
VIAIQNATLGNLPNFSDIGPRTKSPLVGKVHMAPSSTGTTNAAELNG